jgi:hypothetical protein
MAQLCESANCHLVLYIHAPLVPHSVDVGDKVPSLSTFMVQCSCCILSEVEGLPPHIIPSHTTPLKPSNPQH